MNSRGISQVVEKWKTTYKNSEENIFAVLTKTPLDLIEFATKRMDKGIKYYIISQNTNLPERREGLFEKIGFSKYVQTRIIKLHYP